jgi:hypothetical protein
MPASPPTLGEAGNWRPSPRLSADIEPAPPENLYVRIPARIGRTRDREFDAEARRCGDNAERYVASSPHLRVETEPTDQVIFAQ